MWRSLVLCAAVCIVGCGGSTEPGSAAAGTYVLTRFSGQPLPADDFGGSITGGALTLKADRFYVEVQRDSFHVSGAVQADTVSAGQWAVSGTILTLTDTNRASPFLRTTSLEGNVILFTDGTRYER